MKLKGGKKKSSGVQPEDAIAGENGVSSEQHSVQVVQQEIDTAAEEEEDVEKNGEEEETEEGGELEKPKLAEGFYEIETVKRKRVRKGKVQYLIKWRGWPESANTWEPVENLMMCYDVIDAFEESLRTGKQQSTRKRKRKQGVTATPIKKKQQQQQQSSPAAATYNVPAMKVRIIDIHLTSAPLASLDIINHVDSNGNGLNNSQVDESANDYNLKLDSTVSEIIEKNELDLKLSELKEATATKETSGDVLASGFSIPNGTESLQPGRCTGAKRRKPASVRRFRQDVMDNPQNAVANATTGPLVTITSEGIHNRGSVGCKSKRSDDSEDAYTITEIIKPMSYSASVSNDSRDVSLTFLAKRSDGKDVMVDNKFLKMNNPLVKLEEKLLIIKEEVYSIRQKRRLM